MSLVRAFLIACLVLLVGCGGGDTPTTDAASSEPEAAQAEPSESPTPEASEEPTEAETEEASEEPEEAEDDGAPTGELFVSLPSGYKYAKLPNNVRKQMETQVAGNNNIVGDAEGRFVGKGKAPAAIVLAVRFNSNVTGADLTGFEQGVAQGLGVKGKSETVGGQEVTFIPSKPAGYVLMGDDYGIVFFGDKKAAIKLVVAAFAEGLN
jgi:hypothetical protein